MRGIIESASSIIPHGEHVDEDASIGFSEGICLENRDVLSRVLRHGKLEGMTMPGSADLYERAVYVKKEEFLPHTPSITAVCVISFLPCSARDYGAISTGSW